MKMSIKPLSTPWNDCTDTLLHSKSLDEWYTDKPKLGYNVFKLPSQYSFNLKEMQDQVSSLLEKQNTISISKNAKGEKFNRYKGLGFFSRPNCATPLEDHFTRRDVKHGVTYADDLHLNANLPDLIENDFTETTCIMNEYFNNIFSSFKSKITKASLLELRPMGWLGSHVDFPYYKTVRLHTSIFGNEGAWYEVEGEKFQLPQDGHWYFIDTGKYHSVWNHGPNSRITLNVNLEIQSDPRELALLGLL
jgi:hypothetical protein